MKTWARLIGRCAGIVFVGAFASGCCEALADNLRAKDVERGQRLEERLRLEEIEQREREVAAARRAQEEREREEKRRVNASPNDFLERTAFTYEDEGIINSYRSMSSITILNKSRFPLDKIQGEVEWLDESGGSYGTTPFWLTGSLPAGDTKTFTKSTTTLRNGTVKGNATKVKLRFTSAVPVSVP